jgi:hypothetical protein
MLRDVYVLKTLRFGTLMLCAATFGNITSCDVYVCCFTLCSNIIKCIVLEVFGDRFVEKDRGMRTHNPSAEEVRELEIFFY